MSDAEFGAYVTLVITGLGIVLGFLALLMPIFVWRIQSDVNKMRFALDKVVRLLSDQPTDIKTCPKCRQPNRMEDTACMNCGGPI